MTKDPTHIPDNVQAILKGLPVKDQVVLRAYIASLREHVKGLEHKLLAAEDGDEHAHYHGKAAMIQLMIPDDNTDPAIQPQLLRFGGVMRHSVGSLCV
mmetsp:Transcript_21221/g.43480  ORF Transcript_21221/g.43480 Transcript_21221/m.43480 type:complete len:98 (-) Transcript_21221:1068-1361(-)